MKLFCGLTEWQSLENTVGKYKGGICISRKVLALDNWNWVLGTQRGGKDEDNITGEKYFSSFKTLFYFLFNNNNKNSEDEEVLSFKVSFTKDILNIIVEKLKSLTHKTYPVIPEVFTEGILMEYGKKLDDLYGTSFGKEYPPKVMKTLFGVEEKE